MTSKQTVENIILVDPDDKKIGEIEKLLGHRYGMLHRAFSVLIFRERHGKIETLLQQRNKMKYHAGGLWTNTCCSHPHSEEDSTNAAETRLNEEMGIDVKLTGVGKFHYIAKLDNGMTENEIDHVFIGTYEADEIPFNPIEVEDYLWVDVESLQNELAKNPKKYTPWFKQALDMALAGYKDQ